MIWENLHGLSHQCLFRGVLFRFPAKRPFEEVVDFMIFDPPWSDSGYGMLASTGYYAGMIEILLPAEASFKSDDPDVRVKAISTKWLQKNWRKWVYDVSQRSVKVCIGGRPMPRMPKS